MKCSATTLLILILLTTHTSVSAGESNDLADFAKIYVYREGRFVGGGLMFEVLMNGERLAAIPSGTYYAALVRPGQYTLELDDKSSGARWQIEAGKAYYVRMEIVPGVFVGGARLTVVQPEQGSYEVEKLRAVTTTEIRNHAYRLVDDPHYPMRRTMQTMRDLAETMTGRRRVPANLPVGYAQKDAWGTPFRVRAFR